jgi:rare lipoprotein A (peptidoglycan hydrolase)
MVLGCCTVAVLVSGPLAVSLEGRAHRAGTHTRVTTLSRVATVAAVRALEVALLPVAPPAAPVALAAAAAGPAGPAVTTVASWYPGRPEACYEHGRRTALPPGLVLWTASKTLPCGSTVEVTGPAGRAELLVEDRGPYVGPTRDLDLSPAAFRRVVGPLVIGTATVTYRLISSAELRLQGAQAP